MGYRWHDQQPLFPFGHGHSYGEYRYGLPRVEHEEATGAVTVSLEVTNVGGAPAQRSSSSTSRHQLRPGSPPGS